MIVLTPNRVVDVVMAMLVRLVEGVVSSSNHNEQPTDDGQDLIDDEVRPSELLAFRERIVYPSS